MPATEEITAAPNAAIGDNLGIGVPSNTGASIATSIAKKKNNVVARMNTNKSKSFKSQAKSQHSHPPYGNMIKAALLAAQDKKGSSRAAILKYIMQNFAVGENPTLVSRQNFECSFTHCQFWSDKCIGRNWCDIS